MVQKEARRVTQTKKLLRNALVKLILEKGHGAITVQDILDRADVGRSTFYTHFNSTERRPQHLSFAAHVFQESSLVHPHQSVC